MRVEVIKSFGIYSIGAIIPEMFPGQARTLIARGMVREVKTYETKPAAGVSRMMKAGKRGRDAFES